jgi:hypothetical protein
LPRGLFRTARKGGFFFITSGPRHFSGRVESCIMTWQARLRDAGCALNTVEEREANFLISRSWIVSTGTPPPRLILHHAGVFVRHSLKKRR